MQPAGGSCRKYNHFHFQTSRCAPTGAFNIKRTTFLCVFPHTCSRMHMFSWVLRHADYSRETRVKQKLKKKKEKTEVSSIHVIISIAQPCRLGLSCELQWVSQSLCVHQKTLQHSLTPRFWIWFHYIVWKLKPLTTNTKTSATVAPYLYTAKLWLPTSK